MSQLLTIAEAAKLAGVARQTVYDWIDAGDLEELTQLRRTVVNRAEVLERAQKTRRGPKPQTRASNAIERDAENHNRDGLGPASFNKESDTDTQEPGANNNQSLNSQASPPSSNNSLDQFLSNRLTSQE